MTPTAHPCYPSRVIKHIVMWTLKDEAEGADKAANARRIQEGLEGLAGRIPGLSHIEVGLNLNESPAAWDVVLYSELVDREALAGYQAHPEHRRVAAMIERLRETRAVVDYETA